MPYVYLLHLDAPLSTKNGARHYIGFTRHVPSRMEAHRTGKGARFMQVAREKGISWCIARIWEGDRSFEKRLKQRKSAPRFCPLCRKTYDPRQLALDLEDEDLL